MFRLPNRRMKINRRDAINASLLLSLAGMSSAQAQSSSTVLVAYLSRTNNTRVIARQISRSLNTDLFEIETVEAYPEDYDTMVAQAQREKEAGFEPPVKATVPDIARYQTVFPGFPIWGMTAPSPVRSFLSKHDLAGKTIVPFITNGGYGVGDALSVLTAHAPNARLVEGLTREYEPERDILNQVTSWVEGLRL